MSALNVCYRCREIIQDAKDSISCSYCGTYWHLGCQILPTKGASEGEWRCAQHQGKAHTRRHRQVRLGDSLVKVKQPQDDIIFQEADAIVDYGGVVHSMDTSTIESEFLSYARKYREYQSSNKPKVTNSEAREWLDTITLLHLSELPAPQQQEQSNGIQMLIDAANMSSTSSSTISVNNKQKTQYRKTRLM